MTDPPAGTDPPDREESGRRWMEQEEFARGDLSPGEDPVEPRPAATVVLARDEREGMEILLLRRPERARFAAGAYVFPGGTLDSGDADPRLREVLPPGHAGREPVALVAGLRELFEETGILLSDQDPPPEAARAARAALLAHRLDFPAVVKELGLTFRSLRAVYLARWITPEKLARRYDTRFFLARAAGAAPTLTEEHTGSVWLRPAVAVARFREGRLPMLFPTWKTLESLGGYRTLEEALRAMETREVRPILPTLRMREGRLVPVLPEENLRSGPADDPPVEGETDLA